MKKLLSLLILVIACAKSGGPATSTTKSLITVNPGCFNPVDYGAQPTPADSRVAWEQALAAGAATAKPFEICWPVGDFTLSRAPAGSYNRFAAMSIHIPDVVVRGAGRNLTTIRVAGDQGRSTTFVLSLDPGAKRIKIHSLRFDTTGMFNTDEQTHVIAIGSSICTPTNGTCSQFIEDITIEDVVFVHPYMPNPDGTNSRKGDCVRIGGNTPETQVRGVRIIDTTFDKCARSSVAIQRNANMLIFIGVHFTAKGVDQQWDGEASGAGWDEGMIMMGCIFDEDVASAQGDYAVALTSYRNAIIANNIFNGRGIALVRTQHVTVTGNTILQAAKFSGTAAIDVANLADWLKIHNNTIVRTGKAGSCIKIVPHSGVMPNDIKISKNTCEIDGDSNGLYAEAVQNISLDDNDVKLNGPAPNGTGFSFRSAGRPGDGIRITNNRIVAVTNMYAAIRISASPNFMDGVDIIGNSTKGIGPSLRCDQALPFLFRQPVLTNDNRWHQPPTCSIASLVPTLGP